ncbi:MAG: alkylation response protein AidB-like acyl-CoA dehydrogenase, partial [Ilumatobacter sp.]
MRVECFCELSVPAGLGETQGMSTIYDETHELFRESFAAFVDAEMVPKYHDWEAAGIMDRELYTAAGKHGFVGLAVPEQHGGGGSDDFRFNAIIAEELAKRGINGAGLGLTLHNDIVTPYFIEYCNDEQADRWLPGIASGELVTAIAMTEPGTGSDLAGIKTTAVRDGDEFVLNGAKTFITNGINSDLVVVVCITDPEAGRGGMSLLVVERGMDGFERGRNLDKIGQKSADTAELFFSDVRVPAANVLGEEGKAMEYLAFNLAQERLSIGIFGVAAAKAALDWTVEYVKERTAFGTTIASFQNTKFVLAEVATEVAVAQPFIDQCLLKLNEGTLTPAEAAMAKLHGTELQNRATDRCLQLFGGYGFMTEYPIGPAYVDARVTTIYGGTSEIMKTIISKDVL